MSIDVDVQANEYSNSVDKNRNVDTKEVNQAINDPVVRLLRQNTHMRSISAVAIFSITLIVILIQSCNKNETNISQANGRSHNAGRNCMDCHRSGGEGKGWFTAAGSAYNALDSGIFKNAVVQLYTAPTGRGTLVATVYGDASGNFYTTSAIDFSGGLYPVIVGSTGTNYMHTLLTVGACNSCHGVSQTKIIAN